MGETGTPFFCLVFSRAIGLKRCSANWARPAGRLQGLAPAPGLITALYRLAVSGFRAGESLSCTLVLCSLLVFFPIYFSCQWMMREWDSDNSVGLQEGRRIIVSPHLSHWAQVNYYRFDANSVTGSDTWKVKLKRDPGLSIELLPSPEASTGHGVVTPWPEPSPSI